MNIIIGLIGVISIIYFIYLANILLRGDKQ